MTLALERGYEPVERSYGDYDPPRSEISVSFEKYPLEIGDTVVEHLVGEVFIRPGAEPGSWEFDRIEVEPNNYIRRKVTLPERDGLIAYQYLTKDAKFLAQIEKEAEHMWGEWS